MVLVNLMTCEEAVKTMKKASECYARCVEDCMGEYLKTPTHTPR